MNDREKECTQKDLLAVEFFNVEHADICKMPSVEEEYKKDEDARFNSPCHILIYYTQIAIPSLIP